MCSTAALRHCLTASSMNSSFLLIVRFHWPPCFFLTLPSVPIFCNTCFSVHGRRLVGKFRDEFLARYPFRISTDFWNGRHARLFHQACGSKARSEHSKLQNLHRNLAAGLSHTSFFEFYSNVFTLHSGTCYRKYVCRLSITFVHSTQPVEIFPLCFYAILSSSHQPCNLHAKFDKFKCLQSSVNLGMIHFMFNRTNKRK